MDRRGAELGVVGDVDVGGTVDDVGSRGVFLDFFDIGVEGD